MSSEIADVHARQVWDSRGRPTVEVEVTLASGKTGRSIAPSGASIGKREALERRDGGSRLSGYGVNGAIAGVNSVIRDTLLGQDASCQKQLDTLMIELDGTVQKSRLGGNAIIATSCAIAWAAAVEKQVPLWRHLRELAQLPVEMASVPSPMIQIFGGGRHASGRMDIQDILVLCPGAKTFAEAMEWTADIYVAAAELMAAKGRQNGVADEGGIWPDFSRNEQGLEVVCAAIQHAGLTPGRDVVIALDVAASSFVDGGGYRMTLDGLKLTSNELVNLLVRWCHAYPIASIEDPVSEDDDDGFIEIMSRLGDKIQIVGDDYLATNARAIERAGQTGACNAALLKANQCGSISELIAASETAKALGWNTIQSGRSGESEDVTLSHLAVGLMSDQIKVGSIARSERTAKWNEVLRIEETLGDGAFRKFAPPGLRKQSGK